MKSISFISSLFVATLLLTQQGMAGGGTETPRPPEPCRPTTNIDGTTVDCPNNNDSIIVVERRDQPWATKVSVPAQIVINTTFIAKTGEKIQLLVVGLADTAILKGPQSIMEVNYKATSLTTNLGAASVKSFKVSGDSKRSDITFSVKGETFRAIIAGQDSEAYGFLRQSSNLYVLDSKQIGFKGSYLASADSSDVFTRVLSADERVVPAKPY